MLPWVFRETLDSWIEKAVEKVVETVGKTEKQMEKIFLEINCELSSMTCSWNISLLLFFFLRQNFTVSPWLPWNAFCMPGWSWTHRVNNSASQILGLKACASTQCTLFFFFLEAVSYIAQVGLKLSMQLKMASSPVPPAPIACVRITGMQQHAWLTHSTLCIQHTCKMYSSHVQYKKTQIWQKST